MQNILTNPLRGVSHPKKKKPEKNPTYWSQHNVFDLFIWFDFHHPEFRGKKCSALERRASTAALRSACPAVRGALAETAGATSARKADKAGRQQANFFKKY